MTDRKILPIILAIFALGLFCASPLAAEVTLRIVNPNNTNTFDTFGVQVDDTGQVGDFVTLEVWLDARDTVVNGAEIHLRYDPNILQLQELGGDSHPSSETGVQIGEDHSQLGDVLLNVSMSDTISYAALTNADSFQLDIRVCTMTFRILAFASTTTIDWRFNQAENQISMVTSGDDGRDILQAVDSGIIGVIDNNTGESHVLISEVLYDGLGSPDEEFIELYNPRSDTIDLSRYYLSDTQTYYELPSGTPALAAGDFIVKFPDGSFIGPEDTILIALNSDDFNVIFPGLHPDFEVDADGNNDNIPDMEQVSVNGTPSFTNTGEILVLFKWNGFSDLVEDVDIVVWENLAFVPNKTGQFQDGPDPGTDTSTYATDSATLNDAGNAATGNSYTRIDVDEDGETRLNGNGLTGNDETTEDLAKSFTISLAASPYHDDLIAYQSNDFSGLFLDGETNVEVLEFFIQPASFVDQDTITTLQLRNLGSMDDTDVDSVAVYADADNSLSVSTGDTFLGFLVWNGASQVWETTAAAIPISSSGETILIAINVSDSVTNGETFHAQVDTYSILMSVSDSGPFQALLNPNPLSAVVGTLLVSKNVEVGATLFTPGATNVTVMSIFVRGDKTGDTLLTFTVRNDGDLDSSFVDAVRMYEDADGSNDFSAGDTFVALLTYDTVNLWFDTDSLQYTLASTGNNFIITIDVNVSAVFERDTFLASVVAFECTPAVALAGPASDVTNANGQILVNPAGVADHPVISQVYPNENGTDDGGHFIEIYNPTNQFFDMSDWVIREDGQLVVFQFGQKVIGPGRYYLIGENNYITASDNDQWPAADTIAPGAFGWSVTNDGISLSDTSGRIIDAVGWGTPSSALNYESGPATAPGGGASLRRRSQLAATTTEMNLGGRRFSQGRGYDSFDNTVDFLTVSADTDFAPKNSSFQEFPDSWSLTVDTVTNVAGTTISTNDSNVTVLVVRVTGDTNQDNLILFGVQTLGNADTGSVSAVNLWKDNNGDLAYDAGDSFVAELIYDGTNRWDTSGINFPFVGDGDTFLVTVDASGSPTTGDTLQFRVTTYSVNSIDAESGPAIAVQNNGVFTFSNLQPLVVSKNAEADSRNVARGDTNITVIAFNVSSPLGNDTIDYVSLLNLGNMDTSSVDTVALWIDDGDSTWSTGDTFVAALVYSPPDTWFSVVSVNMPAGNLDFVITISITSTAPFGDTFQAQIGVNGFGATGADSGPAAAVTSQAIITVDTFSNVNLLISEIVVAGADWIELYCVDDGNGGAGADISGWYIASDNLGAGGTKIKVIGDTNLDDVVDTPVIIRSGEFLVIVNDTTNPDESSSGADNIIMMGATPGGSMFTATDDQAALFAPDATIKDAVAWSNRDGSPTASEITNVGGDLDDLIQAGQWSPGFLTQNNCVNPSTGISFPNDYSIARQWPISDTNTRDDWSIDDSPSTGTPNTAENPITIPADIVMSGISDVPNDLGGSLKITWQGDTSLSAAEFSHYNVYISTGPITDIRNSDLLPNQTITDSSTESVNISGLVDGDSYWAAVTLVDTFGHEDRVVTDTGPAAPIRNVVDTPIIRITEVSMTSTPDTVELLVIYDGNPTGGLNLSGFTFFEDATIKTIGSATVNDSAYIVLEFNSSKTDDVDTAGDNILNLYTTDAGLTSTDESLFFYNAAGDIVDFVFWSSRDGSMTATEAGDVQTAINLGAWQGFPTQNSAVNPIKAGSFQTGISITRNANADDSDSFVDWVVDTTPTFGGPTDLPNSAFTAPDSITGVTGVDVVLDQGSNLLLTWDTVNFPGFSHYNVYRSITPFLGDISNSDSAPLFEVDTASVGYARLFGLTPGQSYYLAVTAVNIYGAETNIVASVGPITPVDNIPGSPEIVINEVAFNSGGGGIGNDWIELHVKNDGNNGSGFNLVGWSISDDDNGFKKTFGDNRLAQAVVDSGSYIILEFNNASADETDTNAVDADGVLELYTVSTGLDGGGSTDENVSLRTDTNQMVDFVAWGDSIALAAGEANNIDSAITFGQWVDNGPANADTEDVVRQDTVTAGVSIARLPNATDSNNKTDWSVDQTPTPGNDNSFIPTFTVTMTIDLEARPFGSDTNCTVTLTTGAETFIGVSNGFGTVTLTGVSQNTYNLFAKEDHHLQITQVGVAVNSNTDLGALGILPAGDANDDNRINVLDGSLVRIGTLPQGDIDGDGDADGADLNWVRKNFGQIGQR